METGVRIDPLTGEATLSPTTPLPVGQPLRFALFDLHGKRYLTRAGWAKGRKTLFECVSENGSADLVLDAATAAHVAPGTPLVLEEIFINLREQFSWPAPPRPAPVVAAPAISEPPSGTEQAEGATPHQTPGKTPPSTVTLDSSARKSRLGWLLAGAALLVLLAGGTAYTMLRQDAQSQMELIGRLQVENQRLQAVNSTPQSSPSQDAAAQKVELQAALIANLQQEIDHLKAAAKPPVAAAEPAKPAPAPARAGADLDQRAVDDLKRENGQLQARIASLEATNVSQANAVDGAARKADLQAALIASLQAEVTRLNDSLKQPPAAPSPPRAEDASLQAALDDAQRVMKDLRQENLQLQARASALENQISSQNAARSSSAGEIQALQQQLDALKVDRSTVQARVEEQAKLIESRDAEIAALRSPLSSPVQADSASWLAAAVDRGGSLQSITNQVSRESAEKIALKLCGGAANGCSLVAAAENACLTLSRPRGQRVMQGNWWHAVAPTWQDAERQALFQCDNGSGNECDIRFTVCSPARLAKPQ